MEIKKIIKSQRTRHTIMRLFSWLPDNIAISIQYYAILHRWPNLKNPRRFTEWIQVYKMKYRNPLLPRCVDKYEVRGYIEEKGCGKYLNELYQVCDTADKIDFGSLPDKFVIKTTNGGNGDNVMIVKDKSSLDFSSAQAKIRNWLSKNYASTSREWAYSTSSNHPRIIVEKFLENQDKTLDDFKFFCFNGQFKYLWMDKDRFKCHKRGWWDERLNYHIIDSDYPASKIELPLPDNIREMVSLAEKLAKDFPFVRVDLYNVEGKIIFGELTFYPASGYSPYNPDTFDYELGHYFPDFNTIKTANKSR